jgi:hypothetical protein
VSGLLELPVDAFAQGGAQVEEDGLEGAGSAVGGDRM